VLRRNKDRGKLRLGKTPKKISKKRHSVSALPSKILLRHVLHIVMISNWRLVCASIATRVSG
jgi:hypothetical protein